LAIEGDNRFVVTEEEIYNTELSDAYSLKKSGHAFIKYQFYMKIMALEHDLIILLLTFGNTLCSFDFISYQRWILRFFGLCVTCCVYACLFFCGAIPRKR